MVEYVLLLVVLVGLVLGSMKIFKTIDSGIQDYIGKYFVCLMEYGELPTLGVQNTDLKKHMSGSGKKCDTQFEAFSFDGGRPPSGGGGSSGGSGSSGNNSQSANGRNGNSSDDRKGGGSNSAANADRSKNGSVDDTSDGSNVAGRSGKGSGSGSKRPEVQRAGPGIGTLDSGIGEDDSKSRIIDDEGDSSGDSEKKKRRRPRRTVIGYADDYRAIGGKALQEIEKTQKRFSSARKPTSTVLKIDAEEGGSGPYRKAFTPPERKPDAEIKDKESGFSFGSLFKWLLIGGMIVAIIVFFGGQLLNYSNSD